MDEPTLRSTASSRTVRHSNAKTWPEYDCELVCDGWPHPGIQVWTRLPEDAADAKVLDIYIPFRIDMTKDGAQQELDRMIAGAVDDVRLLGH